MAGRAAAQAEPVGPGGAPRQVRGPRRGPGGRTVRFARGRRRGPVNASQSRGTIARLLRLSLIAAACWASSVQAHEVRPAYLEMRETAPDTFDVTWKVPARGEYRLSLHARLPGECSG